MAKRADNKEGSLREVLRGPMKGRWRVQYTIEHESGRKQRLSRHFPTKTEGRDFLRSLKRETNIETARRFREMTLSEWFDWLAANDWPESLAEVTIDQRKQRFDSTVRPIFGKVPLSQIDPLQVRAFYKDLKLRGEGAHKIISIRGDLVRAFNQARQPYQRVPMTVANPFCLSVEQPEPRQAVALIPDQVKKAIRSRDLDLRRRAELALFLLAGARLGEQMAMTRQQLRFDDDLIVIDRAVRVAYGGKQRVGLPKKNKTRNAVMCRTLKEILWEYAKDMEPDQVLWSAATENIPRMKKLVYATWRTIRKDAKLPEVMSPQDCRLTHMNIIEKLMPEVSTTTYKEHIGHAAVGVTEASYTRPLSTAQAILRDSLDRMFA